MPIWRGTLVARLPCVAGESSTANNVALTGLLVRFRIFIVHIMIPLPGHALMQHECAMRSMDVLGKAAIR